MNNPKKVKFFALDLEMEQPSNEIISIGVAYQVTENEIYQINHLITPSQPLSQFIKDLTHMNDSMFDWSKSRYECFCDFVESHQSILDQLELSGDVRYHNEAITWGCGDVPLLREALNLYSVDFNRLSRRFVDVKTLIVIDNFTSGKTGNKGLSLNSAMKSYKLDFTGTQHNSADDATNTLRLFESYFDKKRKLNEHLKQIGAML